MSNGNGNTNLSIPIIGGLLLVLLTGWLVATTQVAAPESTGEGVELSASEARAEEAAGASDDGGDSAALLEAAIPAAEKAGCAACHVIPGVPNAQGQVGPNLTRIGADAATRIDGYTAEDYIYESIAEPNAFTSPECPTGPCPPGAMPVLQLSEDEMQAITDYLVSLK